MKKILFFLALLCTQIFAETWKESGLSRFAMSFSKDSEKIIKSLDDDSDFHGIYFIFNYSNNTDYGLHIKTKGGTLGDSIWISKYWMDDSLADVPVVPIDTQNIADFRILNLDSSTQSFKLSSIMDDRLEGFDPNAYHNYKSLYFLYKKESSYYAYCVIGTERNSGCQFFWSCIFQNDGTLNFEEIPSSKDVDLEYIGLCPLDCLYPTVRHKKDNQQTSPLYNAKGKPADKNSSGVSLQKGVSKVNLKKPFTGTKIL